MSSQIPFLAVHLRRALLLFAIVLGTAALVASLSRPVEDSRERLASYSTSGLLPDVEQIIGRAVEASTSRELTE